MQTYTKKYTHHLKPNKRAHDDDHWVWYVPGQVSLAYSMHRTDVLYAVRLHATGSTPEARGVGMTPRAAYREAYRALRQATRHDLQDVFQELGDLRRKFNRLLAQRAELLRELNAAKQNADGASQQIRDLRAGLDAVRAALDGVTTHAAGQPLDKRVRAVAARMVELDRLYTAAERREEELKRGQAHQAAVIAQMLQIVREAAGEHSPKYARALSLARAVGISSPAKPEATA